MKLRELTFAAMMAACVVVCSNLLVVPLMKLQIPGLRHFVMAPVASFFYVLTVARLRRPGSILLVAGLQCCLYALISWIICLFVLAGAVAAEVAGLVLRKDGYGPRSQVVMALTYSLVSFPTALYLGLRFMPKMFAYFQTLSWAGFAVSELAIAVAGLAGALLARRVVRELVQSGRFPAE